MKPKRLKSRVAGILIGSLLASSVSYAGSWQQEAGQWVYQEGTVRATGWLKEPGDSWYHFTPEGIMAGIRRDRVTATI